MARKGTPSPYINQVDHPPTKKALQNLFDRMAAVERQAADIGTVSSPLSTHLDSNGNRLTNLADPSAPQDAVTKGYLQKFVAAALTQSAAVTPVPVPSEPPIGPSPGTVNNDITLAQPNGIPPAPNLRWFRGNLCGIRVAGLPAIPGGNADPSLVLTWLYHQYTNPADRQSILANYVGHGYTHFHLSWPDARTFGVTPAQYVALAQEVTGAGLYCGHFWCGKDQDSGKDVGTIMADVTPVMQACQAAGVIPWASVGWELSLWRTPTEVQQLIDAMAPILVPGTNLYVHFQQDYIAFQQPGGVTADFWNLQVGKLTGVLHQRTLGMDNASYQDRIDDGLQRFAGNDGFVNDSGFGHPFDYVTFEVTAQNQFSDGMSEGVGDSIGLAGIMAIAQSGPAGTVAVMGYGNGCTGHL